MKLKMAILGTGLAALFLSTALADFGPQVGTGRLSGTVYKMGDRIHPVVGALVQLFDENDDLVFRTTTNSRGAFYFTGLQSGTYTVRAEKPGDGHGVAIADVRGGYTTTITVMLR